MRPHEVLLNKLVEGLRLDELTDEVVARASLGCALLLPVDVALKVENVRRAGVKGASFSVVVGRTFLDNIKLLVVIHGHEQ